MQQLHAPEPWAISVDACGPAESSTICSTGDVICECGWETGTPAEQAEAAANAERIVACVNACAGIEDPAEMRRQHDRMASLAELLAKFEAWLRKNQ